MKTFQILNGENRFYVYIHKTINNEIFYVGKGRNGRAWETINRTELWKQHAINGYFVEILKHGLSESAAISLEESFILEFNPLANSVVSGDTKLLPIEEIIQRLEYSLDSPSGLRWIKTKKNAGYIVGNEYKSWMVTFKGVAYYCHRIIWAIHDKLREGLVIDHIDGNPLNNDISNLRQVTRSDNSKNKIIKNSMHNITYRKQKSKTGRIDERFVVQWSENKKQLNKAFCLTKTQTLEEAKQKAIEFRDSLVIAGKIKGRNDALVW